MLDLFVDRDDCPVYAQIQHVALRQSLNLYVVTRDYVVVDAGIHLILTEGDSSTGEEWIARTIATGDICVTSDLNLASRCILGGASALTPTGDFWNSNSLFRLLKIAGRRHSASDLPPLAPDTTRFVSQLEAVIRAARLAAPPTPCSTDRRRPVPATADPVTLHRRKPRSDRQQAAFSTSQWL
jgi:uncharacterized protein YaiI (UPF0178 family)